MKKLSAVFVSAVALLVMVTTAFAATTVIVTPTNTQGWSEPDTRAGGAVNFISDSTSPFPSGALQLTTDATTTAKAQYLHAANVPIAGVTELSYHTKQNSALFIGGDASYQLVVLLNGTESSFTTFVYEPYQNGAVIPGQWQFWDVDAGQFWSSRPFTEGSCIVAAGGGGAPFYTLASIQTMCPNAVAVGFGVNIGSNNPSYDVETDGVTFNGTTYDFELANEPGSADECKNGGWQTLTDGDGNLFTNQGQCVAYANHSS
jgi:hypothetical protein